MEKRQERNMEPLRKPFQGIYNIIRFNWHYYVLSFLVILILFSVNLLNENSCYTYINILVFSVIYVILMSLIVSFYIYDYSDLYSLKWIDNTLISNESKIVNIHAGFDETSAIIKSKFPTSELVIYDFYNPKKHTEISIKRARKIYLPFPNTQQINTDKIPLEDNYADLILIVFSAHEIRNRIERINFLREINRIIKPNGKVILTEHLRNLPNFLAYNIGFFHFLSFKSWKNAIQNADLKILKTQNQTPFITHFVLTKNGNPS